MQGWFKNKTKLADLVPHYPVRYTTAFCFARPDCEEKYRFLVIK